MNGLDLFTGIAGITVALEPWVRPVAYCEQDRYAQGVLLSRMQSGDIDRAPIWDDVRTLSKEQFSTNIDIISGGFPCQDISSAGNGEGLDGERSRLFFEITRLCSDLRPRFVFLENVPAITVRGLDRVLLEFTKMGYDTRWTIVSAAEVGAPHLRERWYLLAHSDSDRSLQSVPLQAWNEGKDLQSRRFSKIQSLANTNGEGLERWVQSKTAWSSIWTLGCEGAFNGLQGLPKPALRRNDDGLQSRVDRIKCLGNSVVPLATQAAFKRLMGLK